LGGRHVLGRSVHSMRELDVIVREGMPKSALDKFIAFLTASNHGTETVQLRNKIVSRATYQRVDRFNVQVGETTERLARLYALALSVFEDRDAAKRFLMNPHPELDGRTPFDVALTEIGGREVEEVIERGLHGLPA
ncbi:MAG: antitoxin Xre/MbcA/ParS toxin-binding domain-containing protein, partial [Pseudomonadota bacterium]|nr:antitoxin Xre/MbcA/ParS toxin-binding domain-containing protein [Pseudomonadota bacterium]